MCVCVYMSVCVYMCVCVYMSVYIYVYVMCICVNMCLYVCLLQDLSFSRDHTQLSWLSVDRISVELRMECEKKTSTEEVERLKK